MSSLLPSEKLVLLSLVQDANCTDAEIGNSLNLKKGTVSSIRRRLERADAFQIIVVPSFARLGCELMAYERGVMSPGLKGDARTRHYVEYVRKIPQMFFGMVCGDSYISISVHQNAEDHEDMVQSYAAHFTGNRKESRARVSRVLFPYAHSKGTYNLNFAHMMRQHLKLDAVKLGNVILEREKKETPDLSKIEKDILVRIVENPESSDRALALMAKVSRQAVTRIRNRLEDDHIIKRVCLPYMPHFGFELFLSARSKYFVDLPWETRIRNEPAEVVNNSFFTLTKPTDGIGNYLFSKFAEFRNGHDNILEWYSKVGVIEEPPELTLFPMERLSPLRAFEYGPAVRHVLGLKRPAGS